jgi:hypothetical protein
MDYLFENKALFGPKKFEADNKVGKAKEKR